MCIANKNGDPRGLKWGRFALTPPLLDSTTWSLVWLLPRQWLLSSLFNMSGVTRSSKKCCFDAKNEYFKMYFKFLLHKKPLLVAMLEMGNNNFPTIFEEMTGKTFGLVWNKSRARCSFVYWTMYNIHINGSRTNGRHPTRKWVCFCIRFEQWHLTHFWVLHHCHLDKMVVLWLSELLRFFQRKFPREDREVQCQKRV